MKDNKNFYAIILGAVIIGGFLYLSLKAENVVVAPNSPVINSAQNSPPKAECLAKENSVVTKVIDGDTIVVEGGYHVRLIGIDADENSYPCYESAKNRLENLILNKMVKLEKDRTDLDKYGRCLRYVFFDGRNIDAQLVAEGLAVARFYNDVKYKTEISDAEKQALASKTGCKWSKIP